MTAYSVRRQDVFAYIGILCAVGALFARPLMSVGHIINPPSDLINFHFFARFFSVNAWRATGEFPLWNPLIYCGIPFVAAAPMSRFFPLNWLFFIIPVHYCLTLFLAGHFFIGGIGTYTYIRSKNISVAASLFGAFTLIFSFKLIAHVHAGHFDIVCPFMYTPWLFFLLDRFFERRSYLSMLPVSVVLSLSYLIGHSQIVFYQAGICVLYVIFSIIAMYRKHAFAVTAGFTAIAVMTVLFTAITLLPTIQYASFASRTGGVDAAFAGSYSLTWNHILSGLLNPYSIFNIDYFWEYSFFFGYIPLILIVFSFTMRHVRHRIFFIFLFVAAFLFSLGANTPFFRICLAIPGIGFFRCPSRMWLFGIFAASVLASLWLERVMPNPQDKLVWRCALVSLSLCVMLLVIDTFFAGMDVSNRLIMSLGVLGLSLLGIYVWFLGMNVFAGILIAFTVYNLASIGIPLIKTDPIDRYITPNPLYTKVMEDRSLFRVYDTTATVLQYQTAVYGFQSILGDQPLNIAHYIDFIKPLINKGIDDERRLQNILHDHRDTLSFLNVKYLFTGSKVDEHYLEPAGSYIWQRGDSASRTIYLYRNKTVAPRAFFVAQPFAHYDRTGQLLVSKNDMDQQVTVMRYEPDIVSFKTECASDAILVTSEVTYPGWRATVDTNTAAIQPLFGVFRAVEVPAGTHTVTFEYRPALYFIGRSVSLIAVCVLGVVIPAICAVRQFKFRTIYRQQGDNDGQTN